MYVCVLYIYIVCVCVCVCVSYVHPGNCPCLPGRLAEKGQDLRLLLRYTEVWVGLQGLRQNLFGERRARERQVSGKNNYSEKSHLM